MKRALILAGGGSRGAFQIGVWKYLVERNWTPDIICGTSIGAVNAAGILSGLDVSTLARLWTTYNRRKMYQINTIDFLAGFFSGHQLRPLFDSRRLQSVITDHVNIQQIRSHSIKLVISTVNVQTAQPCFFDNSSIDLEHIFASSAIPVLFPWHEINGVPHWDGGIMSNIPLQPALDFGADEIIIVTLSPVGHRPQALPKTVRAVLEHVFEQFLNSAYHALLRSNAFKGHPPFEIQTTYKKKYNHSGSEKSMPNIITLAPEKMLGFRSLINFSLSQARQLIVEGYKTAHLQLKPFI
jgi:NTE family protein